MYKATTLRAALSGVVSRQPTRRQFGQLPRRPGCWEAASFNTIHERNCLSLLNPGALVEVADISDMHIDDN